MVATVLRSLAGLGELILLFAAALRGSFRRPFYWQEFLEQCRVILAANLLPLFLTGFGFGVIVALEAGQFFRSASAESRLGGFTVMSNIREFSPIATGLMIAAVSGTAIVADLGARQVRSELEALSVMGLSNVLFIVVPRALALMLMTALYNFPMILFTMLASYVVGVYVVGVNAGAFMASFFTQGTVVDVIGGEVKCVVFGAIVAAISIARGVSAKGGAEGVATAVHSSVIWSFVGVLAFEYLFTPTVLALYHDQLTLR